MFCPSLDRQPLTQPLLSPLRETEQDHPPVAQCRARSRAGLVRDAHATGVFSVRADASP